MDAVALLHEPSGLAHAASIGVYLGSFDPPHIGHAWIAEQLAACCEQVLLLVPSSHFHKTIQPPLHATIPQRLELLECIRGMSPDRVGTGVAGEVLFLELEQTLQKRFPAATLSFAMGDETWTRLASSRDYYAAAGRVWTAGHARRLTALQARCLVFDRSGGAPGARGVPDALRAVSSTRIRAQVAELLRTHADEAQWARCLDPWLPGGVRERIRAMHLYGKLQAMSA